MSVKILRLCLPWLLVAVSVSAETRLLDRYVPNDAFGTGEWFQYSIGYGIIEAGTATMEVKKIVEVKDRPVYQIMTVATSNRVFDAFYPVRDTMFSLIDAEGIFSWRFEKRQHEGDYHRTQEVRFEQAEGYAIEGKDTIPVPEYVQDVLSAFYFIRTQELRVGDTLILPNMTDKMSYDMQVIVHARETISTPAGEFVCLKIEPVLLATGIFRNKGKVFVWLTDDRLHMPVLVRSRIIVGAIHAKLTAYRFGELWEE